ncbi:transposase family protein [Trinickia acidisoli]|uniref:transposase family protein n=1 Tax=Trinickia acidisoli TaxID=2767482 RepID=UPI001F5CDC68|nr:transposase family protein [Trinickia acidisoli]
MTTRTLVHWLEDVEDPRDGPGLKHDLTELLVVAVCAIIAGAQSFTDMAMFAQLRLPWLRRYLLLENGAPSHDTFGRVFRLLDAKRFRAGLSGLDWQRSGSGAA